MKPPAVILYTRAHCPLCEKAKKAMWASGVVFDLTEVDIDLDLELLRRYNDHVPVIFVDGVEAFRHAVDSDAFALYVAGRRNEMNRLAEEKCVPCRGGVPPLAGDELRALESQLGSGWKVVDGHHLEKEFRFPDFAQALAFTNRVGAIAEKEGHHPDIYLAWGKVRVTLWTHKIDGLTRSDFILAARIEAS